MTAGPPPADDLPMAGERVTIRSRPQRFEQAIEFDHVQEDTDTRIGVVVPFDFSLDWEYWMYLPPRVALHFTRTPHLRRDAGMYLARAVGRPSVVARTARTLLAVEPSATLYACTSGSYINGVGGEAAIRPGRWPARRLPNAISQLFTMLVLTS
ncbi:MAG: hypothetical protein U5R31_07030 [Acidimicrobiia bacterium]|nr:hypothetical protein [Acidimicrobiia bacterium]